LLAELDFKNAADSSALSLNIFWIKFFDPGKL
jgi:hypothetical protein